MAKGKTNQPLTIICTDDETYATFKPLQEKGHTVLGPIGEDGEEAVHGAHTPDIIVGTKAHYFDKHMTKHVETVLKWARARKKEEANAKT